jgi:prophage antirepressor-like protein
MLNRKMSKTKKVKRKIINLDDPNLVLPEIELSDDEYGRQKIVKNKIHSTKRILEKTTNTEFETENVNINDKNNTNKIENIFNYDNNDIVVIVDKNMKAWCRAKDVALALGYSKTKSAISTNVNKKYKLSFADIGGQYTGPLKKIDPQSTFINQTGVLQLVLKSRKPECEKFAEWLSEEVIPSLMNTGKYEMPITETDIKKLNKNFYDDHMLSKFIGSPCVYFAYIGEHKIVINGEIKTEHIIKYGQSRKMDERDLKQHRKFYKTFNVLGIWKTLANVEVEKQLETNFRSMDMIVDLKIKGMNKSKEENRREHIILTEKHNLEYCLNMIENVIKDTSLPQENEYKNKIKDLEHKNELLTEKNKHLNELNQHLKDNLNDLRKKGMMNAKKNTQN